MTDNTHMSKYSKSIFILLARLTIILLGIALLFLLLVRPQDDSWSRLQQGNALRVAIDPSFPPFDTMTADGQVAGFDVALARELGRRLGVPVTFITIAFDGLADAIIAGRADVVISAFPLDERLTENVRYSHPYFEAGLVMVTRADSSLHSPQQLTSHKIAVEWGSPGDAWAREKGLSDIQRLETPDDALDAVKSGQVDVAIVDAVSAALYSKPGLIIHAPPLVSDPYVIVLPKQAPKLAEAVDKALSEITADGTWETLTEKYFLTPPISP